MDRYVIKQMLIVECRWWPVWLFTICSNFSVYLEIFIVLEKNVPFDLTVVEIYSTDMSTQVYKNIFKGHFIAVLFVIEDWN